MGCGSSEEVKKAQAKRDRMLKKFQQFQFSEKDVDEFKKKFDKMDVDGRGTIDVDEFVVTLRLESSKFTERVFEVFTEDHNGTMDFYQYVVSLWNYCTLDDTTLSVFAFDIYDRSGTGELNDQDINLMLNDLYGKGNAHKDLKNKTKADLKAIGETINVDQFKEFCKTHGSLMFPAFRVQNTLQEKTLGKSFWKKHAKRQIRLKSGDLVSIARYKDLKHHAHGALTASASMKQRRSTKINSGALGAGAGAATKSPTVVQSPGSSSDNKPKVAPAAVAAAASAGAAPVAEIKPEIVPDSVVDESTVAAAISDADAGDINLEMADAVVSDSEPVGVSDSDPNSATTAVDDEKPAVVDPSEGI